MSVSLSVPNPSSPLPRAAEKNVEVRIDFLVVYTHTDFQLLNECVLDLQSGMLLWQCLHTQTFEGQWLPASPVHTEPMRGENVRT